MKRIFLFLCICCAFPAFAIPGIREALKNPAGVTVLRLSGETNEAALLTKNGTRFIALTHIVISGISDSIVAEQDIAAVAACPSVTKLTLENCGARFLSGAVRMLVNVNDVEIVNCKALDAEQMCATLAGMPGLKSLTYETNRLDRLPASFSNLRFLGRITFRNTDLSLADGYALNTSRPEALYSTVTTQLGFGAASLTVTYGCYDRATAQAHATVMRDMLQGLVGTTGQMPAPQKALAFDRKHPLVKQPIPGLDVRKNVYTASAKTGGLIEYPSGTKIFIPANAFVDANGNKVTGDVTIDYREFRDPVDIIISGIPMKYDSAGQSGDFESAGMFELNASVDGQEVFLASGKKVDMEFAVVDTASTYNFYVLDEKAGWKYLEQTGSVEEKAVDNTVQSVATRITSAAADAYILATRAHRKLEPWMRDTVSFDNRYSDTDYVYTTKMSRSYRISRKNEFKYATYWKMRRVGSEKGTTCFTITNRHKHLYYSGSNPEMSTYRGVTWMFNQPVDKKTFKQLRSSRSGINDIRLTYEGGSTYTMELKLPSGYRTFSVTPVKMDGRKPVAMPEKTCTLLDKRYQRTLANRGRSMNNGIRNRVARHKRWEIRMSKDSVNVWKTLRPKMTAEEQQLSFREWANYAVRNTSVRMGYAQQSEAALGQSSAVYQALSVMKFGIYNCDQIRRIESPQEVFALAYSPDGAPQQASQMFVVNPKRNQAFSYYSMEGTPVRIAFGSRDKNKLLVINGDGSVAFADVEAFDARKNMGEGNTRFITTPVSTMPVSAQQLRELMFPEKE